MKYYHIAFASPFGFGTLFYRGEENPLEPETYKKRTEMLASQFCIKYAQHVPAEAITYISVNELPIEVAKARWPEDFKDNIPCHNVIYTYQEPLPPFPTKTVD